MPERMRRWRGTACKPRSYTRVGDGLPLGALDVGAPAIGAAPRLLTILEPLRAPRGPMAPRVRYGDMRIQWHLGLPLLGRGASEAPRGLTGGARPVMRAAAAVAADASWTLHVCDMRLNCEMRACHSWAE